MSDGELIARHYSTGAPVRLGWAEGRVSGLSSARTSPPNLWLAPALVDLQINGFAGIDFQQDHLSIDGLLHAVRGLRASGCTRFLVTLMTAPWAQMIARLRHLRALRRQSADLQAAIAGWHLEGPFLSGEPGFRGAHDASVMCDPTLEHIRELREVTGSDPVLMTLAPERPGAIEAIARAVELGMSISLGHTNASEAVLRRATAAGARGFTHLGNGCPRELDRHDNILWRVWDIKGLTISLIPDAIHVTPALFRSLHRVLEPSAYYYTTDAMAAAGAPPGRYTLGAIEMEVAADQVVRLPGSPFFAGSALTPMAGIERAAGMLGCSWREVWGRFSAAPARFMGWPEPLAPGTAADFCVLEAEDGGRLETVQVFVQGRQAASQTA